MWLTGFDAPSLHTMYVDKPMRGHGLMQAIARVNRVFRDKPGGLVVDYLGLAQELKAALATYTESGGTGSTAIDQREAVALMLAKHEVCCGLFHGFTWAVWGTGSPAERLGLLPPAQEHILVQEDGKNRLLRAVHELSQAFALSVPHAEALRIRDDVAFFQAVRASLAKRHQVRPSLRRNWTWLSDRSSRAQSRPRASSTSSPRRDWRSPTSRSSPTSSSPKCGRCRSGTLPWSCCRSCCRERSSRAHAETWSRAARSPICWSRRCGSTRTGPSRLPRSSRS